MDRFIKHEMNIKALENRKKTIRVFLPIDYQNSDKRYSVLYMHDGQNLIDPSAYSGYSWDVQNTVDRMQEAGTISGIIIVGIDCDSERRICEYSGAFTTRARTHLKKNKSDSDYVPEGKKYAAFIVDEVKPFVDSQYRTYTNRENTGIAGSSCGGNISLYMACWYPEVFGVVGAFSPAYSLVGSHLYDLIEKTSFPPNTFFYHDMGTKEGIRPRLTYLRDVHRFQRIMLKKGFDEAHLQMVIDKLATHTELFWQARFPDFLELAFPAKNKNS